jgi:hypothetical protein
MRLPQVQINPTSRIAATLHVFYLLMLPLLILALTRSGFIVGATAVIVISKWRMFAVKPRYWMTNIRANSVDIIVGLSILVFMVNSSQLTTSLIWASVYAIWLIFIKPRSSTFMVSLQAFIAQGIGLVALFNNYSSWHPGLLVLGAWAICYSAARHILMNFENESSRTLTHIWAIFGAELSLVLGHWHVVYAGVIPMVALVLSGIGYALALGYYLANTRGLSEGLRRQLVIFTIVLLLIIAIFSQWQSETF